MVDMIFDCSFLAPEIPFWELFTLLETDKERVTCNKCGQELTYAKQSTHSMQKHHEHHINTESSSSSSQLVRKQNVQKIPVTKDLKESFIAALCTVTNLPFLHLSHPLYRCLFAMAGFGTVNAALARKSTDSEYERSRKLLVRDFRELKRKSITFTLITDEWTTSEGERFVAVILRSPVIIASRGKNTVELMTRIRTAARRRQKTF